MMWAMLIVMGVLTAAVGATVGSFINVCVYRIPWEKSVIWPASHCPKCLTAIRPVDNIPIVSWFLLRGKCRTCGLAISPRYPLIELFTSALFTTVYFITVVRPNLDRYGAAPIEDLARAGYQCILIAFLMAASLIDIDLMIIPDRVTVTGMVAGLAIGVIAPGIRPEPATSADWLGGFWVGLAGLLVGGGSMLLVRVLGALIFRKEALGMGDVTLMAMIGAFLGWRPIILTVFLASFLGIFHTVPKIIALAAKRLTGGKSFRNDHELTFGPYLSAAAVLLMLTWEWVWNGWAKTFFESIRVVFWYLAGMDS